MFLEVILLIGRGGTANIIFQFPSDLDFSSIDNVNLYITAVDNDYMLTKTREQIYFLENHQMLVKFTQEELLGFENFDTIRFQWHWRDSDNNAFTSKIEEMCLYEFIGDGAI